MALASVALPLKGFFRWWLDGLRDVVPEKIQKRFERERDTIYVGFSQGEAVITQASPGQQTPINTFRFALGERASAEQKAALAWLSRHREAGARILILLPASECIRKSITLPLAAEENLREVIGFEMDRLTPFHLEEIYFDYRILERDPDGQRLRLELFLSPRAPVDAVTQRLNSWGFKAQAVAFADPAEPSRVTHELTLLADGDTRSAANRELWVQAALIGLLLFVAFFLPLYLNGEKLTALQEQIAQVRKQAGAATRLRQQLEQLRSGAQYVVGKRKDLPLRIATLDQLARLMPDDAWLNRLQVDGNQITIQGEADRATTLIEKLESSQDFAGARFTSPIRQNIRTSKEQYNLSAEIVGEKG
ncbi:MAG: PilN domain-containing protein [Gammaproteobacteria bacterium]